MIDLPAINDYESLLVNDTPLLDTRAPIEFKKGAFPNSQHAPLMSDDEREEVGTCYQNIGKKAALELGHKLVSGTVKEQRLDSWMAFFQNNPNGILYCFRGGLRSQITQRWIFERSGVVYPRIKGGYKAIRRYLIDEQETLSKKLNFVIVGGQTGAGKTLLLHRLNNSIDLEGLANHRGSAFGNDVEPQPTQINFENALSIELIKNKHHAFIALEDEGTNIGTIHIPNALKLKTQRSKLVVLKASVDERIELSLKTYVTDMHDKFCALNEEQGFENFANYWRESLGKIRKRLGGVRYQELLLILEYALARYHGSSGATLFLPIIETLLVDYYDPMYAYQINSKKDRIIYEGGADEIIDFLRGSKFSL
ncbi:MAG: tRNA 2-selenouridine(34) synthase MnmH [Gammaproteobacteria bacterium]|nr:tRNA 2-selenouridine(34) synthase MnmH [Gammaproteobacteria bacterium]